MIVPLIALAAAQAMMTPSEVADAMVATFNRHDTAALAALYAPDAQLIQSNKCVVGIGPADVKANEDANIAAMPDAKLVVVNKLVSGDMVALELKGVAKALPGGEMPMADFLTIRGGKIVRDMTIWNNGEPCH